LPRCHLYNVKRKERNTAFLDTKIKSVGDDPDRKWITIWNDYLNILSISSDGYITAKRKQKTNTMKKRGIAPSSSSNWKTPSFASIKKKITKRISAYLETEVWERDNRKHTNTHIHMLLY
jgi:integrase/recombinase XerD